MNKPNKSNGGDRRNRRARGAPGSEGERGAREGLGRGDGEPLQGPGPQRGELALVQAKLEGGLPGPRLQEVEDAHARALHLPPQANPGEQAAPVHVSEVLINST